MIYESKELIAEYLLENRSFEECLLVDVRWKHFGTVIELVFNYIWHSDGSVLPEYAPIDLRILVLRNVQELHLWNALNEHMTLHPDKLNWGLSEVASVRLVEDEVVLSTYQALSVPFHHLRCNWETNRQIDVVFSTLEVL